MIFLENNYDKYVEEDNRKSTLEKSVNRLSNTVDKISKIIEHEHKEIYKELYNANINIFRIIDEIMNYLSDCVKEGIIVDTKVLDQINFIPYSLTKLKEDINAYAKMAKNESDNDKFMTERNKLIEAMPPFLHSRVDELLLTEIKYDLILRERWLYRYDSNIHAIFPTPNNNDEKRYLDKNIRWNSRIMYVASELDNIGEKISTQYINRYKLHNVPETITLDVNNNKAYELELFGKSIMIIEDSIDLECFISRLIKRDGYSKKFEFDKDTVGKIIDEHYSSAKATVEFQKIIPSDDYLEIIINKINNDEFANWFALKQIDYLSTMYFAYVNALTDMKKQVINIVAKKHEFTERMYIRDIILNPNNYSDEEIKKYIRKYISNNIKK